MAKCLIGIFLIMFGTISAEAGTKAYFHIDLYQMNGNKLLDSKDGIVGVISNGTAMQLKNALNDIDEELLRGSYQVFLQEADGSFGRLLIAIDDYSSVTKPGMGGNRYYSFQTGMRIGDTSQITFTLGDLLNFSKPGLGKMYQMNLRLDRLVPCDDQTTCFEE